LELLVVLFIIGLLAGVAVPSVQTALTRARETALAENLTVMRKAIDDYYADKWLYPATLESLVEEGYVTFIPVDPVGADGQAKWATELDPETSTVIDIHSLSQEIGTNGKPYKEW
jgi:general secretion pathway protein G